MNEIKQLDEVLSFLANEEIIRRSPYTLDELFKALSHENIPTENIHAILNKMEREHYVDISRWQNLPDSEPKYRISFEGKILVSQGGYGKMIEDKLQALKNDTDRNQRMEINELRLATWTKRLFYGTIAAALIIVTWEMIKTFCIEKYCH